MDLLKVSIYILIPSVDLVPVTHSYLRVSQQLQFDMIFLEHADLLIHARFNITICCKIGF